MYLVLDTLCKLLYLVIITCKEIIIIKLNIVDKDTESLSYLTTFPVHIASN